MCTGASGKKRKIASTDGRCEKAACRISAAPRSRCGGLAHQNIAKDEHIHLRPEKAVDGFLGTADDRLVVVERSIQHHGHAGEIAKFPDQPPVARVRLLRDRLEASGAVHVSGRGNGCAFLGTHRIGLRHERRWIGLLEIFSRGLREHRRSERPEHLAMLDPGVQNILHIRAARIGDDAAISQAREVPTPRALETSREFFRRQFPSPLPWRSLLRAARKFPCPRRASGWRQPPRAPARAYSRAPNTHFP